jgi:L-alanine-DL-glutamate epimerase-like enolase superfamily enzyme
VKGSGVVSADKEVIHSPANDGRQLPSDRSPGLRLHKLCEPLNQAWFEEPVYQDDARLVAYLCRQTTIPLAAGQNEGHRWRR